jgi:Transposase DDE domain
LARLAQRNADYEARCTTQGRRPRGAPPSTGGRRVARAVARLARTQAAAATASTADPPGSDETDQVNVTDLDSRVMPTQGGGWVQGYNAQAAVSKDGIVVAADVAQDISDTVWCEPMSDATRNNLDDAGVTEPVGTFLFDAGYWSNANGANVSDHDDGRPSRLIATTKSHKQRQALRDKGPATGPPPSRATPAEAMEHRLRTAEGQALYSKRQHTVEPVFGDIKHTRGFRRFSRRGLDAARAEWQLITATHNLLKLHRSRLAT